MKFYSTWQEALQAFIRIYGHNYNDCYNLMVEFEALLVKNKRGVYILKTEWKI